MNIDSVLDCMKARQRQLWLGAAAVFIFCFSIYVMMVFVVGSDFLGMGRRSLQHMLEGTAYKPHVFRVLVPMMINTVLALTPEWLNGSITEGMHAWLYNAQSMFAVALHFRHRAVPQELVDENLYPFALAVLVDYGFLMGYVYYVWRLAQVLVPKLFSAQVIAPCLAILVIPPFCGKFAYIYDFPVLFFSAWLTYVLLRGRMMLFTVGVALATLNKETSFFYIMLFAMYGYFKLPRVEWRKHLAVQCGLFAVIKGGITVYFVNMIGDFLWVTGPGLHVMKNLDGYSVYNFMCMVAAIALLGTRWGAQPLVLRCWLALMPVSVFTWFCFGQATEFRVMYEVFPALLVIVAHTIAYGVQMRDEAETTPEQF